MLNTLRPLIILAITLIAPGSVGCYWAMAAPPAADSQPAGEASIDAPQLRDLLANMAKAHEDKGHLAFGVSTPFKPVDPLFKTFYQNMGTQNKELLAQLKTWAKEHHVDLTFRYPDTVEGRAQKLLDERQEKVARKEDQQAFERDMLMQMAADYDWNLSLIQALLPSVQDAGLKVYLQNSQKMYEDGSAEIQTLLKHYKLAK